MDPRKTSLNPQPMVPLQSRRCRLEASRQALRENVAAIRSFLPSGIRHIAVVKANAYGLGVDPVVSILGECGIRDFAVANLTEAEEVLELAPKADILFLSAPLPEEDRFLKSENFVLTISSEEEINRFRKVGRERGKPVRVHLKIDTGMGRLGVWHPEAKGLLETLGRVPELRLEGIYTHFYDSAGDPDGTARQRQDFINLIGPDGPDHSKWLIHADNSGGIFSFPGKPFNGFRCGLLHYGISPGTSSSGPLWTGLKPVVSLTAGLTLVKSLPAGTGISYGHSHRLARHSRVGVISAGYADGIPRSCSNRGSVLIRGRSCPLVGNITMDEIMVDLTGLPEARSGDPVVFVGTQDGASITMEKYASNCGTIPWESLCLISRRVPRIWA